MIFCHNFYTNWPNKDFKLGRAPHWRMRTFLQQSLYLEAIMLQAMDPIPEVIVYIRTDCKKLNRATPDGSLCYNDQIKPNQESWKNPKFCPTSIQIQNSSVWLIALNLNNKEKPIFSAFFTKKTFDILWYDIANDAPQSNGVEYDKLQDCKHLVFEPFFIIVLSSSFIGPSSCNPLFQFWLFVVFNCETQP